MSNISRQDLKTILLCAVHLAKVDNEFHMMEREILRRISDAIGLKAEEREDLVAMGGSLAEDLDSLSSVDAKELLLKTLCAVSYVDGSSGLEEVEFIEKVQVRLGIEFSIPPKGEWNIYEEEVFAFLKGLNS